MDEQQKTMTCITSRETWDDGSLVSWKVSVREVPMDESTLEEWYDRDAETNRELIESGAVLRVFVVEEVLISPDVDRSGDASEPVAGNEFLAVKPGAKLVVFMNHREWLEKLYGGHPDYDKGPTLINIQDCGFNVSVEEN